MLVAEEMNGLIHGCGQRVLVAGAKLHVSAPALDVSRTVQHPVILLAGMNMTEIAFNISTLVYGACMLNITQTENSNYELALIHY